MNGNSLKVVEALLDGHLGPEEPDAHQRALGSLRGIHDLELKKLETERELEKALQFDRQFKKLGLTKDQVAQYIRADQKYAKQYNHIPRFEIVPHPEIEGETYKRRIKPHYPPDSIVGVVTKDGREIMFDYPVVSTMGA